jgi:GNAT superfamily N-acetyltransferase
VGESRHSRFARATACRSCRQRPATRGKQGSATRSSRPEPAGRWACSDRARPISRGGTRRRCIRMFLGSGSPAATSCDRSESVNTDAERVPCIPVIVVRALRSDDQDRLMLIFERLGPQSRVQRFLGPRPVLSERDVSIITRVDGFDHAGVLAFAGLPSSPVGAAHFVRANDSELAEISVEVVDEWQRRGIGRLLIERLRVYAIRAGVRRFEWLSFESNLAVVALAGDLREVRRARVGGGVVKCSAAIRRPPPTAAAALLDRPPAAFCNVASVRQSRPVCPHRRHPAARPPRGRIRARRRRRRRVALFSVGAPAETWQARAFMRAPGSWAPLSSASSTDATSS